MALDVVADWTHEGVPPLSAHPYDIWDGKQVRHVRYTQPEEWWLSMWPYTLIYTDCTHPMQNILCSERYIKAWRSA